MSRLAILFLLVAAPGLSILLAVLGFDTLRVNVLGWFLLLFGIAYPAGGAAYYFIRRKPFWQPHSGAEVAREESGDRSFWLILPGFLAVFFAPPLEWLFMPPVLPRVFGTQLAGLALIIAGLLLHAWARRHIRGLYSGHVEVQADARLVQSGPYRIVRHPGYLGFLLLASGMAIGYSSWIGSAATVILLVPALVYRSRVEERLLVEQFGDQYQRYMSTTRMLIPGVW